MPLRIVVCETLLREVACLVEGEDVLVESVPLACFSPPATTRRAGGARHDPVLFVGCGAHRFPENAPWTRNLGGHHCTALLGGLWLTAHIASTRGYAVTPSWVAEWPRRLEQWGFDLPLARKFFREFADRLVLVDSETDPEAPRHLRECAEALELVPERVPVGLDHLGALFREARNALALEEAEQRAREARQQASEAVMVMDLLGQVAELGKEEQVAARLYELCSLLFAPRGVSYVSRGESSPGSVWHFPSPPLEPPWTPPANFPENGGLVRDSEGFSLGISWGGHALGVLQVRGVAYPEHLDRYAELTARVLSRVAGLAVANARTFASLERTLKDREFLLKEIHHRVKNNLNLVVSLLSLQDRSTEQGGLHEALDEAITRIHAIAQLHEFLYRGEDLGAVPLVSYLQALVGYLGDIGGAAERSVTLTISGAEDLLLETKRAVPCGLLVTELVTNALKYAFPRGGDLPASPEVRVTVERRNEGLLALEVRDNGRGGNEPSSGTASASSLGTLLVNALTQQLEGTLTRERTGEGYVVALTFPEKKSA